MRRRYGLASPTAQIILTELDRKLGIWGRIVKSFDDDRIRMMQSFNGKTEEIYTMAKVAKRNIASQPRQRQEFVWQGFVNCKMSDTDKANFEQWDCDDDAVWDGIAQYCVAGYKVTMIYTSQNKAFTASMTGQPEVGVNHGWCVNAFAADVYNAARALLYKVAVMLPEDWSEYQPDASSLLG